MVSRSGMGGGNVMGTIRHTVSPKLWGEVRGRGKGSSSSSSTLNIMMVPMSLTKFVHHLIDYCYIAQAKNAFIKNLLFNFCRQVI